MLWILTREHLPPPGMCTRGGKCVGQHPLGDRSHSSEGGQEGGAAGWLPGQLGLARQRPVPPRGWRTGRSPTPSCPQEWDQRGWAGTAWPDLTRGKKDTSRGWRPGAPRPPPTWRSGPRGAEGQCVWESRMQAGSSGGHGFLMPGETQQPGPWAVLTSVTRSQGRALRPCPLVLPTVPSPVRPLAHRCPQSASHCPCRLLYPVASAAFLSQLLPQSSWALGSSVAALLLRWPARHSKPDQFPRYSRGSPGAPFVLSAGTL